MEENLYTKMYFQGRKDAELSKIFWTREEPQPNCWYVCLYNNGFPCVLGWSEVNYMKDGLLCWHKLPPYEEQI